MKKRTCLGMTLVLTGLVGACSSPATDAQGLDVDEANGSGEADIGGSSVDACGLEEPARGTSTRKAVTDALHAALDSTVADVKREPGQGILINYSVIRASEFVVYAEGSLCLGDSSGCKDITTEQLATTAAYGQQIDDGVFDGNHFVGLFEIQSDGSAHTLQLTYGATDRGIDAYVIDNGYPTALTLGCEAACGQFKEAANDPVYASLREEASAVLHGVLDSELPELGAFDFNFSRYAFLDETAIVQASLCAPQADGSCRDFTVDDFKKTQAYGQAVADGYFDGNRLNALLTWEPQDNASGKVQTYALGSTDVSWAGWGVQYSLPQEFVFGCGS